MAKKTPPPPPTCIAWYKKTLCMASLRGSIPLKEKEKFDSPPLTRAPGSVSCSGGVVASVVHKYCTRFATLFASSPLPSPPLSNLYFLCGFNVRHPIAVVLLNPSGDGEDVGVKDDVVGIHVRLLHQQVVRALANC